MRQPFWLSRKGAQIRRGTRRGRAGLRPPRLFVPIWPTICGSGACRHPWFALSSCAPPLAPPSSSQHVPRQRAHQARVGEDVCRRGLPPGEHEPDALPLLGDRGHARRRVICDPAVWRPRRRRLAGLGVFASICHPGKHGRPPPASPQCIPPVTPHIVLPCLPCAAIRPIPINQDGLCIVAHSNLRRATTHLSLPWCHTSGDPSPGYVCLLPPNECRRRGWRAARAGVLHAPAAATAAATR